MPKTQSRFEILWTFPQKPFVSPANRCGWWFDAIFPDERSGIARLAAMEKFVLDAKGAIALYHVEYLGSEIVSERVIKMAGRKDARPPARTDAVAATPAVLTSLVDAMTVWDKARQEPARGSAAGRRRKTGSRSRTATSAILVTATLVLGAVSSLIVYFVYAPEKPSVQTPGTVRMTEAEARYGTMMVPNGKGSCDRMSFDNRSGRTSFGGEVPCDYRPQPPAREAKAK